MAAHDDCVLWTLVTPSGQSVMCYAITGVEGLAVTVERDGKIILAEMVSDLDAAVRRANEIRAVLLTMGLKPVEIYDV